MSMTINHKATVNVSREDIKSMSGLFKKIESEHPTATVSIEDYMIEFEWEEEVNVA